MIIERHAWTQDPGLSIMPMRLNVHCHDMEISVVSGSRPQYHRPDLGEYLQLTFSIMLVTLLGGRPGEFLSLGLNPGYSAMEVDSIAISTYPLLKPCVYRVSSLFTATYLKEAPDQQERIINI